MEELIPSYTVQEKHLQLAELYQSVFPSVCKFISKKGGSLEEAKDVFHDALIICYEKSVTASFINDEKAYVFGVAKHLWHKRYKENLRNTGLDSSVFTITSETEDKISSRILLFLKETGSKCMELLQAFYYDNHNAEEIADRFGYSGIRSATVQKFKCLEKVRALVKSKSMHYEDFLE